MSGEAADARFFDAVAPERRAGYVEDLLALDGRAEPRGVATA